MKPAKLTKAVLCVFTALLLAAGSALAAKKSDKKEVDYPNAMRVEPKLEMSDGIQRQLNKAFDLLNADKPDEAQVLLTKVLDDKRASKYAQALAWRAEAQIKWEKDDYPGAIVLFRKAYDMNALPNNDQFSTLYQVAQLQLMQEKYPEAIATLDEWFKETKAEKADPYALKANAYYRMDKYQDAIDTMKKALTLADKPHEDWTQILMACYFELEQYDEAGKLAQQMLDKDPTNKKLVQQLATIYINADQKQKALDLLSKAKSQGLVSDEDDYKRLAQLYASSDMPKDATATIEEGLSKGIIKPSYDIYLLQANAYIQQDDDAHAIEALNKASPLAKDGNADYQLGYLLYYSEHSKEAKAALTQAIAKGGLRQEGEAYVLLGDANNDVGDQAGAIAAYEKAKAFPSAASMAESRLKALRSGVKLQRSKKSVTKK